MRAREIAADQGARLERGCGRAEPPRGASGGEASERKAKERERATEVVVGLERA